MKQSIIFIAGIHGVGKTTLCKHLSTEFSMKHYSASSLIKEYAQIEFPKSKHIKNILGNQDILISAISELLEIGKNTILDGHFCLLDKTGEITRIPISTYVEMSPKAIVCLFNEVDVVYERLQSRDSHNHDKSLLDKFQEKEKSYSREVANHLEIPYFSGNPSKDREKIRNFINEATKGI